MTSRDDATPKPSERNGVSRRRFLTAASTGVAGRSSREVPWRTRWPMRRLVRRQRGQGTLGSDKPIKTGGSYWPYATTLFDYIRRAMPYTAPGSLGVDDTYAVAAYILNLNGLLPDDGKLDRESLPKVRMPNRDGFIPDAVFKVDDEQKAPRKRGTAP